MRVRRRIQERLDRGEVGLTERDALHLERCARCGSFLRGYSRFSRMLLLEADSAVEELPGPSWERIFAGAASLASAADDPAATSEEEASGPPVAAAVGLVAEGARTKGRSLFGRDVMRLLPAWATTTAAKAAILAVVVCTGALLGYQEYRLASARSIVRSSTTEFVNAIFSSSIFTASSQPGVLTGAVEADAGWFDATDSTAQLLSFPTSAEGSGQSAASPP